MYIYIYISLYVEYGSAFDRIVVLPKYDTWLAIISSSLGVLSFNHAIIGSISWILSCKIMNYVCQIVLVLFDIGSVAY
jgi:hypothetical protein